jgi:hypothetical protein
MARKVEEFPDASPPASKYPWPQWLDGGVWELVPGQDFTGSPATFRSNAIAQANKREGKVRTRRIKDARGGERFYLQFVHESHGGSAPA